MQVFFLMSGQHFINLWKKGNSREKTQHGQRLRGRKIHGKLYNLELCSLRHKDGKTVERDACIMELIQPTPPNLQPVQSYWQRLRQIFYHLYNSAVQSNSFFGLSYKAIVKVLTKRFGNFYVGIDWNLSTSFDYYVF